MRLQYRLNTLSPIMGKNQILGARGEELVAVYLEGRGYQILERNWRIKDGEIDVIAISDTNILVFIEVKTRTSNAFGHPLEAITKEKAHRLQKLALAWLVLNHRWLSEYRIDCAAVTIPSDLNYEIDYREAVL